MANQEITISFSFDEERFRKDLMCEMALHSANESDAVAQRMIEKAMRYVIIERPRSTDEWPEEIC